MKNKFKSVVLVVLSLLIGFSNLTNAAEKKVTIGFSHYTGWEPYAYIHEFGLMDKWNKKYGTNVQIDFYNDYGESMSAYTSGSIQGVTLTNMDALMSPAAGGIVSTVLINGDYSNGNDAIAVRGGTSCDNIKGKEVLLLEGSVSHYALSRFLGNCNMTEDDVILQNTSDADIATVYLTSPDVAVVTWNPPLQQVMSDPDTNIAFSSKEIPGEILDSLYVRSDISDNSKKALVGAWYEAMSILSTKGKANREMVQFMAEFSGATPNEFKSQMRTTAFFFTPEDAINFANDNKLKSIMHKVDAFILTHGLYAGDHKAVGIQYPDGTVTGNPSNIRIHFDSSYTQLAADGKL